MNRVGTIRYPEPHLIAGTVVISPVAQMFLADPMSRVDVELSFYAV